MSLPEPLSVTGAAALDAIVRSPSETVSQLNELAEQLGADFR
jgi:hypothetical protein